MTEELINRVRMAIGLGIEPADLPRHFPNEMVEMLFLARHAATIMDKE